MRVIILDVKGLSCSHCVESIGGTLNELGADASANLVAGSLLVEYEGSKLTLDDIQKAVEDQGYGVVVWDAFVTRSSEHQCKGSGCQ